ncbi:MAG TPA: lamin tail domain-containing protein [Actinophytocola sp.]|uniref:lamin tail domain-containing protein n=1 Tax=Actinophytocola sp. TaxID=1872138 RepID=UPI002DDCE9F5|nr:lamin tail domain-containing protein [Actinophytocola sp.]HEV2782637.1 lamin tail domain-containing protein [Actinophytocola sp.]
MRRVLACLGMAALAFLAVQPAATAQSEPGAGPEIFGQPVINEVATRGPGGPLDQFIEVMNPSRTDVVDISGWQVHVFSSTNQLLQIIILPEGTVLQPVGAGLPQLPLWVLASTAFTGGPVNQPGALVVDIPDNGGVALFNPGGVKIDSVAFSAGATSAVEGTPLSPQPAFLDPLAPAYGRNIVGQDTNNNAFDFKLLTRSPGMLN